MELKNPGYSPTVLIYLQVGDRKISLSDLGYRSARLSEPVEVPPQAKATLILSIDGIEQREDVRLDDGISKQSSTVSFSYSDPTRLNGRQLSF